MNLKNMTDKEIALHMINYIDRAIVLENRICEYLNDKRKMKETENEIRDLYKNLKNDVKADAKYLSVFNNDRGSELYESFFVPSIKDASANGFSVSSNSRVNAMMLNSVCEASMCFRDYYSLDEWKRIAEK